ncbi:MAG: hypothetical protein ACJA0X_001186 [Cyclobacteriaceae bacterium]|jgi:hypothetical protein
MPIVRFISVLGNDQIKFLLGSGLDEQMKMIAKEAIGECLNKQMNKLGELL